jgi:tRNA (guanine-N7-)-methyltransferase
LAVLRRSQGNFNLMPAALHAALLAERRQALAETCAQLLRDRAEFVWEIGCGHGHFLTAYAHAHADRLCIGVDLTRDRIARAGRKRDRAKLANLHFLRAEARDFLGALPKAARFSDLYILFPDPWPKRRHRKHRFLTPAFLSEIAPRAGAGARLYLRTDYEPYFQEARGALQSSADWRPVDEPWAFETPTVFQARAPAYQSLTAVRA